MIRELFRSRRTAFIKPRINIFDFKWTDFVLDRIKQKPETSVGMRRKVQASIYTGSLIQSYIQFHLTPRWNPLKTVSITYKHNSSWTLQEQYNQCWKILFQHNLHSKKPYQGVTNTYTFTNKNKGKITPEKKMQELKTSSSICCRIAPAHSPRSRFS